MMLVRTLGLLVTAGLVAAPLAGQNRFPLTESYDPASVIEPGISPSDIVVVNSGMVPEGSVQWDFAALGLPAGANVDGFSVGFDIFPASGPAMTPPPANCNAGGFVEAEFTLDPTSAGPPGGPIEEQVGGNGVASDTFAARWSGSSFATLRLASDALGVDFGTDLDALAWPERRRFPVYFSVDAPTGAALGMDPASVYLSMGDGTNVEHFTSAELGLVPGDDVNGLAVGAFYTIPPVAAGRVVFSLSRTSPSLGPGAALEAVTCAGLAVATGGAPAAWALPANLGTLATVDNIDGVRITDPIWELYTDGSLIDSGTLQPYDTLRFDGSAGNVARYVDLEVHQPIQLSLQPQGVNDPWLLFAGLGVPTCAFVFDIPELASPMALHPGLSVASGVGAGVFQIQLQYPVQLDLAVQGIVITPLGGVHTTNLVTARLR